MLLLSASQIYVSVFELHGDPNTLVLVSLGYSLYDGG